MTQITGGTVGSTYVYTYTDSSSGTVTGSGAVSGSGVTSFSADLSSLAEGTITLDVTVTEPSSSTCMDSTTATKDTLPPTAICQDITVMLDLAGSASIIADDVDNGSIDAASSSIDIGTFDCSDLGPNTVTLTVFDAAGNSDSCTATVTIEESEEPIQANCEDIDVFLDATGSATIIAEDLNSSASPSTGNTSCSALTYMANNLTFDCDDVFNPPQVYDLILSGVIGDTATTGRPRAIELYVLNDVSPTELARYSLGSANPAEGVVTPEFTFPSQGFVKGDFISLTNNAATFTTFFGTAPNFVDGVAPNIDGNDVVTLFYDGIAIDTFGDINAVEIEPGVELGRLDSWAYTNGWAYRINNTVADPVFNFDDGNWVYSSPGALQNATTNPPLPPPPNPPITGTGFPFNTFDFIEFGQPTTLSRTLTVENSLGSTDTCISNITVRDTISPAFNVVPTLTKSLDANGLVQITETELYTAPAVDACGILRYRVTPSAFPCDSVGVRTVSLTAIDIYGNSRTRSSTVTIVDDTNPVASCGNITVTLDATGSATIDAIEVIGNSSDNCGIVDQSIDISTFDCSNLGPNNVQLTVEDAGGLTDTCTAIVTVVDQTPPTVICQDVSIPLDASGNATLATIDVDNGSTDNCTIASYNVNQTAFTCANLGENTVTLTVTDSSGNTATCDAIVTVVDTVPPVAVAMDITVELDATGNAVINGGDLDNGSSDNCALGTFSVSPDSFTCADTSAPVSVTFTATDASGNSASTSALVTVIDTVDPTAICQNITIPLDSSGNATITPSDVDGGSSVSCGNATVSIDVNSFDCSDLGPNNVELSVTNSNNVTTTCTAVVTIVDETPPTAVCQDITVVLDNAGNNTITAADIDAGSMDACGIANTSIDISSFDCSNIGLNNVVLTVTDTQGNSASCTAVVTVIDDVPPLAACQNITISLDANGNASITADDVENGSFDLCGIANQSIDITSFDCSNLGANNVVLTVTDTSGNTDSCTAIVTVEDNTAPTAICQNITVPLDASGNVFITAADIDGGSTDACGIGSISIGNGLFNCSNVGSNSVQLTVTDTSGNSSFCTANVTVEDVTPPDVLCQNLTLELDLSGTVFITVSDIDAGTTDACGISSIFIDTNSFDCSNLGLNNVTLTAIDLYGNQASCVAEVNIIDTEDPIINCPSSQTEEIQEGTQFTVPDYFAFGLANAVDNCTDPITIVSQNPAPGTLLDQGVYSVSLTAEDDSGNSESCNFDLEVVTLLGISNISEINLEVVPNPVADEVRILTSNTTSIKSISIFELNGKLVLQKLGQSFEEEIKLKVSQLPSAPYLMVVDTPFGKRTFQLIKK